MTTPPLSELCCGGTRSREGCTYHDPKLQPTVNASRSSDMHVPAELDAALSHAFGPRHAISGAMQMGPRIDLSVGGFDLTAEYTVYNYAFPLSDLTIELPLHGFDELKLRAMCHTQQVGRQFYPTALVVPRFKIQTSGAIFTHRWQQGTVARYQLKWTT